MNDELLAFCIYNIMHQLRLRELDTCVKIDKIIEYIEFIMDRDDLLEEAYGDTCDSTVTVYDDINEDDYYEEDEMQYIELWENNEEEITPSFIRDKIIDFVSLNNDYFSIDSNNVVLDKDISSLEFDDIFNESSIGVSYVYIEFILTNVDLLRIIGIIVRTDIAEFLIASERKIGKLYFESCVKHND